MRKNNNWNNQKKHWNSKYNKKKKDEHYLDKFKGATVEVRNGDVNGAIRKLKKILENADRAKEIAKREFYEKPSVRRKRKKDAAVKRAKRDQNKAMMAGTSPVTQVSGFSFMKSKRKRRKYSDLKNKIAMARKSRGQY